MPAVGDPEPIDEASTTPVNAGQGARRDQRGEAQLFGVDAGEAGGVAVEADGVEPPPGRRVLLHVPDASATTAK